MTQSHSDEHDLLCLFISGLVFMLMMEHAAVVKAGWGITALTDSNKRSREAAYPGTSDSTASNNPLLHDNKIQTR